MGLFVRPCGKTRFVTLVSLLCGFVCYMLWQHQVCHLGLITVQFCLLDPVATPGFVAAVLLQRMFVRPCGSTRSCHFGFITVWICLLDPVATPGLSLWFHYHVGLFGRPCGNTRYCHCGFITMWVCLVDPVATPGLVTVVSLPCGFVW